MDYIISNLTESQIETLNRFNKNNDLTKVLTDFETMRNKRNQYHRTYYNKIKDDENKINQIKSNRINHYCNIKNDPEKYKQYLAQMRVYNKNYVLKHKTKDTTQPIKKTSKTSNYIDVDNDCYIVNINKFKHINEDVDISSTKIKQLIINKTNVDDPFINNGVINNDIVKAYLLLNYKSIIKQKQLNNIDAEKL